MTGRLILLRHGQSTGNADGIFTGLLDVPLTDLGRKEAKRAGALLQEAHIEPDLTLVSPLQRARETVDIAVGPCGGKVIDWRLAERNYGALTGQKKATILARFGEETFRAWRRRIDTAPPPLEPHAAAELYDGRGPDISREHFGLTESLRQVMTRVRRSLDNSVWPHLTAGGTVLIVAHGNSLRAVCGVVSSLSDLQLTALNLPTGHPLLFETTHEERLLTSGRYLDPDGATVAAALVAREGGT